MTISHFITVHFITLAWWSFILAQVPISRLIGDAVLGQFHLYGNGVNQDLERDPIQPRIYFAI